MEAATRRIPALLNHVFQVNRQMKSELCANYTIKYAYEKMIFEDISLYDT
jgi:hypothetical protein